MRAEHGPTDTTATSERIPPIDIESFAQAVRRSRERARDVVERLTGSAAAADVVPPVEAVTDEWLAAVEQLRVAEEELRQQNEQLAATAAEVESEHARYQELFELAPDAYLVTDAFGAVRESNQAAAALFRIPRGYLSGKPLAAFVDAHARRVFRDLVNELARAPRVELELRIRPRYGPPAYVSVAATPSRDAAGGVTTIRWILRDVTDQRRAAERLKAISVSIERRVAERTARLEQMILQRDARVAVLEAELAIERAARLAADALAERRADLLSVLSHEIRTPLHASQGYLELIEMGGSGTLTPQQQGYLARMHRVQDYLLNILEGVLALSRLERGMADLDLDDVAVDGVLTTMPPLVQPQLLEKQVRYEHLPGDPSVTVYADREKLQQIILNLVSNAVKFTPAGGLVSLSWEATADAVDIRVRDTGSGIRAADLERIFEPFVQAGVAPRGPGRQGVGLGLAISRRLARLMGGDLTAASAVAEGTTFTLRLPRSAGAVQACNTSQETPRADT